MTRVLLLDTQSEDAFHTYRSDIFPYLLGRLHARGVPAEWWVVTVPEASMHAGGRFVVDVPLDLAAPLLGALAAWKPTLVILSDALVPAMLAALRQAAPGARFEQAPDQDTFAATLAATERFLQTGEWASRPDDAPAALIDTVAPCFERRALGEDVPPAAPGRPVRLLSDPSCLYRRPVASNRFFRDLHDPQAIAHRGCSFCPKAAETLHPERDDAAIPRILAQIEAHQRAEPGRTLPFEVLFEDVRVFLRLEALIDQVLRAGLRPTHFYTMVRADELLRTREQLERVLPRMAAAGHGLRLVSVGAENFSKDENERFNKGIGPEQLYAYHDLVLELEQRFPGTFACPESAVFSSILWTPWTTPADLLANIDAADRLGELWLQGAVGMRLQLIDDVPITELARHDGLVTERFGELGCLAPNCLSRTGKGEQAWRFADERTAAVFHWLIRLDPIQTSVSLPPDDPHVLELRELRRHLPVPSDFGYVALARGLVHAVLALGPDASPADLVRHALGAWLRRAEPGSVAAGYSAALTALGRLRALFTRSPDGVGGYRLAAHSLEKRDARYAARVVLRCGDRELALELTSRARDERCWLASEHYNLSTSGGTAAPTEAERRLGLALLRVIDPRKEADRATT